MLDRYTLRRSGGGLSALLALALGGCAAPADPSDGVDDAAESADELRVRNGFRYACSRRVGASPVTYEKVELALSSSGSNMTFVRLRGEGRTFVSRLTFDASYAPRTLTGYSRYYTPGADSIEDVRVETAMREGASTGWIKTGYGYVSFRCERMTAALHIGEPAKRAPSAAVRGLLSTGYAGDPVGGTPEDGLHVYSLFLAPDGTYLAHNSDARTENGVWRAQGTTLPLTLKLQSGSFAWTAVVNDDNTALTFTRGAVTGTLHPSAP